MKLVYKIIYVALFFLMLLFQRMEVSFLPYYEAFIIVMAVVVSTYTFINLYREDKNNGTHKFRSKLKHTFLMAIVFVALFFIIQEIV